MGIWVAWSVLKTATAWYLVRNIWKVPNISPTHWVQRKPIFPLDRRAGLNIVRWKWSPVQIKEANKHSQIFVKRSLTLHIFCFMLMDYAWITSSQCVYWLVVWAQIATYCILPGFVQDQPLKQPKEHTTKTSLYLLWFSFADKGRILDHKIHQSQAIRHEKVFHCVLRTVAHVDIIIDI